MSEAQNAIQSPTTGTIRIAASILAADIACLGDQAKAAEQAGVDMLHLDIMDGHFVPNISFGVAVAQRLRQLVSLPLDVHLMVRNPQSLFKPLAEAGAEIITVHQEACLHLNADLQAIKSLGVRAGVAINPSTPLSHLTEVLGLADLVLVMTVNPGFGGQSYLPNSVSKIKNLSQQLKQIGSNAILEVDGGINPKTISSAVQAGANLAVVGSALFNAKGSLAHNLKLLKSALL